MKMCWGDGWIWIVLLGFCVKLRKKKGDSWNEDVLRMSADTKALGLRMIFKIWVQNLRRLTNLGFD
ncbi:hypothetical protein HanPSC8_Chr07g0270261 [Helianthus annuus]|uniref:Uncharacterized protein n=1 Tax=Helianthus annuus TaxID=4232 RepID=A0A251U9N9_HELAN|nr:hypothetical protein HanPSC8_Chr07g0270261 [Helianthus annuus]